ncbi:MAG: tRNA guanosine(34) transglycosylase Tgt [Treponemataceae bacterium]
MQNTLFTILHKDINSNARCGKMLLPHGEVLTPAFMPVGTRGAVKGLSADDLEKIGFQIILANTYHLSLRPKVEVLKKAGGLHGFTKWKKNFLTDSGGFQVFSLARLRKLSENGVRFQNHINGSTVELTPEKVVELQVGFNSDIQMQLDICSHYGITKKQTDEELNLTINWLNRAHKTWKEFRDGKSLKLYAYPKLFQTSSADTDFSPQYAGEFFPIVQGGFFRDLRLKSLEAILKLEPSGLAIGGLSVGEPPELYSEFLEFTASQIPQEKAKYVMGIGTPDYILDAIQNGIDIFDCVLPTRNARNGNLFTARGPISIKKSEYEFDFSPIDPECSCPVCKTHTRAYLRHLFREREILYINLASYHNLFFLHQLVLQARKNIYANNFTKFKKNFLAKYMS